MRFIKKCLGELEYVILNCIVCNTPLWIVRRFFYSIFGMKIGKGAHILMHVRVYHPHKIRLGERSWVNEGCYLDGRGGIKIGTDVTIATYSKLITGSHSIDDEDFSYSELPIVIENNVAVFSGSIILGGVIAHSGSVFSALSLVRKGEYKKNGVYGGNPAKFIRLRECKSAYKQSGYTVFR